VREAIRWFRDGEIVIVTDDDRENEGDLVCAATLCTPEKMAFSAEQRSSTAWALANASMGASDLVRPGHVFPLVARKGGVLMRSGHTEAAVDLCTLAGRPEVSVICELAMRTTSPSTASAAPAKSRFEALGEPAPKPLAPLGYDLS
jgi:3,4-dihydroxy 2-butanone 4-phosphate synthase / GTP cyclohydrolase II